MHSTAKKRRKLRRTLSEKKRCRRARNEPNEQVFEKCLLNTNKVLYVLAITIGWTMEGCFLAGGRSAEDCVGSWEQMLGIFAASYGSVVCCVEFCV